jgi:hypothetical protein
MEPLHYLALSGQSFDSSRSALPGAPVVASTPRAQRVPGLHRVRGVRVLRGAVAHSLYRLGDAVAPPAPATRTDAIAA